MGAGKFVVASELDICTGDDCVSLRIPDGDELVIGCTAETLAARLTGAATMAPLVPSLVAVADLVRGDRVALDRTGEAPVSMSRSWATVTDVAKMAGRLPLIMVLTDAETRSRRSLRPEVQVWAMRPAAATGTDAEAAA